MVSPIQVVLNPENFEEAREAGGGGPNRDFFANRDIEFRAHKAALVGQLRAVADALRRQPQTDLGYLKVILRREAWAKSHRPLRVLFKTERTPVVGGGDLGEMLVEARPAALLQIAAEIERTEDRTNMRFVEALGREVPHPSRGRSETGAVERVEPYGPEDRRSFSIEAAVSWLSNPVTGSGYQVELFEVPPPRSLWDTFDSSRRNLYQSFLDGLAEIGHGLTVQRLVTRTRSQPLLAVRLERSGAPPTLRLSPPPLSERRREVIPFDPDRDRHLRLLAFLDHHPLVRRIELPGVVARSPVAQGRSHPQSASIPTRDSIRTHPRLGIIDGGVGEALTDWVVERWDLLAEEDADLGHGTFIGGLAVVGRTLNGAAVCPEADGTELVDLAVFPNERKAGAFASYFPEGLPQFFDEIETAIADAKARHGVRVFNMSLNIQQPVAPDRYSLNAARLDQIAERNDIVLFVSAGNTAPQDVRPEWPADPTQALAGLAAARNDGLLTPAESVRNVAVAAVNPPGHSVSIAHAPARYSRRGPGLRAGVKPDLAHVGGSGSPQAPQGHGLFSISPDGRIVDGCGTSYAAPLVARTAAALDRCHRR